MEWWRLDEKAHAGPEHLDRSYVEGYERKSEFDPSDDIEALRRLGLGAESIVVDLGAGTGVFAAAAALHCREVIAVDVSPAMTAALRTRAATLGRRNLTVIDAGFLSYEHHGPPADFVYTRNALHHLPDFWKGMALQRIASLLRPGGILRLRDLVYDFDPAGADGVIETWFSGAVSNPAAGFTARDLAEHVRTEFSTYSWLLEPLIERSGFEILEHHFRRRVYGTYTCRLGSGAG